MSELLLLKKEDCKSCYKCIRECALKSIRFSENRAQIVEQEGDFTEISQRVYFVIILAEAEIS